MKKILYLMNVDWNWIKQRPQFIAEGLSSSFEVSILYRYKYNRKGLTADNQAHNYKLSRIYTIPFINKQKTLKRINDWIIKRWINLLNLIWYMLQIQRILLACHLVMRG